MIFFFIFRLVWIKPIYIYVWNHITPGKVRSKTAMKALLSGNGRFFGVGTRYYGPTTLLIFRCKNSSANSQFTQSKGKEGTGGYYISWFYAIQKKKRIALTFKQRAEVPPACNAPLRCELSHGGLQEEHGNTTRQQKQDIRD